MERRTGSATLAAIAMVVATAHPAFAAPGALDPSFSNDGKAVTAFNTPNEGGEGVAVRADGRILVVGRRSPVDAPSRFAIAQYLPDGRLDTTFGGGDGKVTTGFAAGGASAKDVALLPSGKFLVAGDVAGTFGIARYHPDGRLDATFHPAGADGLRTVTLPHSSNQLHTLRLWGLQPVLVGTAYPGPDGPVQVVVRLTPSGELDDTFGAEAGAARTGYALTRVNGYSTGDDALVNQDGTTIVAGYTAAGPSRYKFLVVKLTTAGDLDTGFGGGDGWLATRFDPGPGADSAAYGIAAAEDGRFVVAGERWSGNGEPMYDFALARYTASGTMDAAFGTGGKAAFDFGAFESGFDVAVAGDGKVVVVGRRRTATTNQAVMRTTADGTLDTSFGNDGIRTFDVRGAYEYEEAREVALHAGKIVVVGYGTDNDAVPSRNMFTTARLLGS